LMIGVPLASVSFVCQKCGNKFIAKDF
jgi:hypothetical protein